MARCAAHSRARDDSIAPIGEPPSASPSLLDRDVQIRTFDALGTRAVYATATDKVVGATLLRQLDAAEHAAAEYDESVATARRDRSLSTEAVRANTIQQRLRFADAVSALRASAEEAGRAAATRRETEAATWLLSVAQAYQNVLNKTGLRLG